MSIEVMKQALEALEKCYDVDSYPGDGTTLQDKAIATLRAAIERAEQRADAHLFYAQGDVLICKESNEKAVVTCGNTGLRQLVNGKIELAWSDEVYGEYTLEQIMDGFIREVQPEQAEQQAPICAHGVSKIKCDFCKQAEQAQPVAHSLMCVCGAVWDIKPDGGEEMVHTPDAQPASKPVAWRYNLKHRGSFEGVSTEYSPVKLSIGENWTPLYTDPPQRQPLTDEEICRIKAQIKGTLDVQFVVFARAIEAAHGIGGEK